MRETYHYRYTLQIRVSGLLAGLLLALLSSAYAERLPIKTYTNADGLPRDSVRRILQDSRGFLWFSTSEGLSRFDGYQFTNYGTEQGLPHPMVNYVLETRSGTYWVATNGGGVCRLNTGGAATVAPSNGVRANENKGSATRCESKFVVYRIGPGLAQSVNMLVEDHTGALWCGTDGGLYRLEALGGGWISRFVDIGLPVKGGVAEGVNAILEDRSGSLWVGGSYRGLYRRWPDGRTDHYTTQQGLLENGISTLLEDQHGRLWVGTGRGLCRLVPTPQVDQPVVADAFTVKEGLPHKFVTALLESADGALWVGTRGGLGRLRSTAAPHREKIRPYTRRNGLSDIAIATLVQDREGNLWMGTESGGAMRLARNGLTTYSEEDGLGSTRMISIFENSTGTLYAISAAPDGIFINRFDGSRFHAVRPAIPQTITYMGWGWRQMTLQDHTGQWWVPTGQGLCRFPKVQRLEDLAHTPPTVVYTSQNGMPGNEVFRLFEDARGDLWISTDKLTRWERATETFHAYTETEGGTQRWWPTVYGEDRAGHLWMGSYGGGLARYRDGRFTFFTAADGLPAGQIQDLYIDHTGRLWIGIAAPGGLVRVDDPGTTKPHFMVYTTAQGLSSDTIRCITEDSWGRIYVGTGRGVDRLDPTTGHIRHYSTAEGLANNYVQMALRDRQGVLWFGTLQGVSQLIPEPDRPSPPVSVLIRGLRIAGALSPLSELGETEISGLVLNPDQNSIQIEFVALTFEAGQRLRYQYRLEGVDRDWSAPSDQRTVNFAHLSPSSYHFQVRAVNADGLASPTPATVAFTILRPVWLRWWFLMLTAMLAGLVIYAMHGYRLRQILLMERIRQQIATDIHDDIGSGLSQVAILSEVAKRQAHPTVVELLNEAANLARSMRESMSDIVWAVDPRKDSLIDLIQRMRQVVFNLLEAEGVAVEFRAPQNREIERIGLAPDRRRHMLLIFKEAIANIARHAQAARVRVEIRLVPSALWLTIQDDGRGFEPQARYDGHGLQNLQHRAEMLGAPLEIKSASDHGTTVKLIVPLKKA